MYVKKRTNYRLFFCWKVLCIRTNSSVLSEFVLLRGRVICSEQLSVSCLFCVCIFTMILELRNLQYSVNGFINNLLRQRNADVLIIELRKWDPNHELYLGGCQSSSVYNQPPNILFFVGCFAPVLCNKGMCLYKMANYTNYREICFNELHLLKKMKHNQKLNSIENKCRCGLVFDINYYAWSSLSILLISRDRINIPITVVSNDSNCMPYFR